MLSIFLSVVVIGLIPSSLGESNITDSSISVCPKCSPCWNLFGENFGPCSNAHFLWNPFSYEQPVCIDTLILLIMMFIVFVTLIPTSLWLIHLSIQRCRKVDGKYVVNDRTVA